MSLEDLTGSKYIDALVATNPVGAVDAKSQGDDHIRGIKNVLKKTFPNVTGAITATQDELNLLDGVTASTAELNILDGVTLTAAQINSTYRPGDLGALALKDTVAAGDIDANAVARSNLAAFTAGSYVIATASDKSTTSASYVKLIEWAVTLAGTVSVRFILAPGSGTQTAYARIYVNGVAVGTQRTANVATSYQENVTVSAGDLVQIYAHSGGDDAAAVSGARLMVGNPVGAAPHLSYGG